MKQLIKHAAYFAKKRMRTGTVPMQGLCSTLDDLDKVLEQGPDIDPKARRAGHMTPAQPNQTHPPEQDTVEQPLPSGRPDMSVYSLPTPTGLNDEELVGQFPGLDDYNNDALYYYGMDIGTWIGLDSMRWDVV